jgi:hypothetical protein
VYVWKSVFIWSVPSLHKEVIVYAVGTILSSERMLHKDYDRKGSVEKTLIVSLERLGTKTNWLAVNRQSQSNPDSVQLEVNSGRELQEPLHMEAEDATSLEAAIKQRSEDPDWKLLSMCNSDL